MEERGTCLTDKDGTYETWVWNGKLHRDNGPALKSHNGDSIWYREGELHCATGPAWVDRKGEAHWHLLGVEYKDKLEWAVAVAAFKQEYPDEA